MNNPNPQQENGEPKQLSLDEFAAAALTGLCSSQEVIGKAMKMLPGGRQFEITDVTAELAYMFAESMMRAREKKGQQP